MSERPTAVLRLEPHMIPALRQAFDEAVDLLHPKLNELEWKGRMTDTWMNDPVSARMRDLYNERAIDAPDSAYARLRMYEAELIAVRDALADSEEAYRRTEGDNAALWGRSV